jgi:diguanylate cyclase (GGDEF)-like protein
MDLAEKERLALIDPLTGLYNRRYFDRRYPRELRRAQRYRHPLTLLILDIDDFKSYNDRNGYLAGDEVLKGVASILRSSFRQVDVVTRWGGEEFAVLLPETPKEPVEEGKEPELPYARRVLEAVRRHTFPMGEHQPGGRLTLSGGAATYPDDTQDREELQVLANRALRRAKGLGKDRICVF